MANSVYFDKTSCSAVYTVCSELSVPVLRITTVHDTSCKRDRTRTAYAMKNPCFHIIYSEKRSMQALTLLGERLLIFVRFRIVFIISMIHL